MSSSKDSVSDSLRALEHEVNKTLTVPGVERVPVQKLFPDEFMREHTRFESIRAFVEAASQDPSGDEPITPVIDDFVRGSTEFGSWSEMRQKAELGWMKRNLSDHQAGET